MSHLRVARVWALILAFGIAVAGCNSAAPPGAPSGTPAGASSAAPRPVATATVTALAAAQPAAIAVATAEPETDAIQLPVTEGGDAPSEASDVATVDLPEPSLAAPALATPSPDTAVVPASTAISLTPPTLAPADTPTLAPSATDTTSLTGAAAAVPAATPVVTTTEWSKDPNPLQIEVMRQQSYPGSEITVEQTLAPGANYNQYVVSYKSDGYKIYALMTVPTGPKPATGWPVIIFNHGYIPPDQYRTTERYVAYVDAIARAGYIVFKSDYRGHGLSEGPTRGGGNGGPWGGGYGSPGYTNDVLNALSSLKAYADADPNRIGMWGHSLGGQVTLRAMVVSQDIKAGVIWGGVVAPYPDIFARGNRPFHRAQPAPDPNNPFRRRGWQQELTAKYGTVQQNPAFWASISPNSYLAGISGPVQLDHSTTDEEVPVEASKTLYQELQAAGKTAELYTYAGDNHNISGNFGTAMQRSIAFFDKYVKGS